VAKAIKEKSCGKTLFYNEAMLLVSKYSNVRGQGVVSDSIGANLQDCAMYGYDELEGLTALEYHDIAVSNGIGRHTPQHRYHDSASASGAGSGSGSGSMTGIQRVHSSLLTPSKQMLKKFLESRSYLNDADYQHMADEEVEATKTVAMRLFNRWMTRNPNPNPNSNPNWRLFNRGMTHVKAAGAQWYTDPVTEVMGMSKLAAEMEEDPNEVEPDGEDYVLAHTKTGWEDMLKEAAINPDRPNPVHFKAANRDLKAAASLLLPFLRCNHALMHVNLYCNCVWMQIRTAMNNDKEATAIKLAKEMAELLELHLIRDKPQERDVAYAFAAIARTIIEKSSRYAVEGLLATPTCEKSSLFLMAQFAKWYCHLENVWDGYPWVKLNNKSITWYYNIMTEVCQFEGNSTLEMSEFNDFTPVFAEALKPVIEVPT